MSRILLGLATTLGLMGAAPSPVAAEQASAIFAGGCFWCVESDFDKLPGVISTTSGYTGGKQLNPTYQQVSAGATGHTEAVKVVYDPAKVSFDKLVDYFWVHIDPTVKNKQFCDSGAQYRTAIYFNNDAERKVIEATKAKVAAHLKTTVHTEVAPTAAFYPAEDYHQDYYLKNPSKYKFYRWSCGRDQRLEQLWGKRGES